MRDFCDNGISIGGNRDNPILQIWKICCSHKSHRNITTTKESRQNSVRISWDIVHTHINIGQITNNIDVEPTTIGMMASTHWGRVTHICVSNLTIIASDNGLLPGRRQAIVWTGAGILLIGPLGTNFSEILIEIITFSFMKMRLKVSSAKWQPLWLGLNVLRPYSGSGMHLPLIIIIMQDCSQALNVYGEKALLEESVNICLVYFECVWNLVSPPDYLLYFLYNTWIS